MAAAAASTATQVASERQVESNLKPPRLASTTSLCPARWLRFGEPSELDQVGRIRSLDSLPIPQLLDTSIPIPNFGRNK